MIAGPLPKANPPKAHRHEGQWQLCERLGWPDNQSHLNLVSWCWKRAEQRSLIVVNLSAERSQGHVRLDWDGLAGRSWRLAEPLTGEVYERDGSEICGKGLYVDLEAWGFHLLKFCPP